MQKLPSNNDYPHAAWWTHSEERSGGYHADFGYNPSAEPVRFCLRFANPESNLWETAQRIVGEAVRNI